MGCFRFDFIFANFHYEKNQNYPTLNFAVSNSLSPLEEAVSFSTVCTHSTWYVCLLFVCLFVCFEIYSGLQVYTDP